MSGNATNVIGTVSITNGGTGATTASGARSNLGLVIGSNVQPYSLSLLNIALVSGTTGILRKLGASGWFLDNTGYLTSNQTITLSGDISGSGSTSITTTLATVSATKGEPDKPHIRLETSFIHPQQIL